MKNFDTRAYNVSDFIEWNNTGLLDLSPKFQRRSVWTEKAKSYLVDTIARGKPIPKVLITQTLSLGRNIRTVVDGQQRIRAILSFVNGDFKMSRAHNKEFAEKTFSELPEEFQNEFLKYEIGVDMLFDLTFEDILDVFARLNTYSVKLNPQELLNAQYLGYFKQVAYQIGFRYVRFWMESDVITEKDVTRMAEAEFASDLLIVLIDGIQAKKAIPNFYKKYDDNEMETGIAEHKFDQVMTIIGEIYNPNELKDTNFQKVSFFYSLFCAIAHSLFKVEGLNVEPRINITKENIGKIRAVLDEISARFDEVTAKDASPPTQEYLEFIESSRRATTDASVRRKRSGFICRRLAEAM